MAGGPTAGLSLSWEALSESQPHLHLWLTWTPRFPSLKTEMINLALKSLRDLRSKILGLQLLPPEKVTATAQEMGLRLEPRELAKGGVHVALCAMSSFPEG